MFRLRDKSAGTCCSCRFVGVVVLSLVDCSDTIYSSVLDESRDNIWIDLSEMIFGASIRVV